MSDWRKSAYCAASQCVEVTDCAVGLILVRDSGNPYETILKFTPDVWMKFIKSV